MNMRKQISLLECRVELQNRHKDLKTTLTEVAAILEDTKLTQYNELYMHKLVIRSVKPLIKESLSKFAELDTLALNLSKIGLDESPTN